jgi:nitrogen-specific signal transduction histidine kinase
MAQVKLIDTIKANKLFEHVSPDDLKLNANQKDVLSFKEGDIIFQTGDASDQIYLLLEGEVKIKYVAPIDGQRIFEKAQGDFFGEKEFMERLSRRSSAVANKPVSVYVLRRKELNDLITKHRPILNSIQRLDPARSDFSDFSMSKEVYSDEINNILKNPDASLEPFGYTNKKPQFSHTADGAEDKQTEKAPSGVTAEEFPKKFNKTFEDSFTFSNSVPSQEGELSHDPNTDGTTEDQPVSFSWDFASTDTPHDETTVTEQDPLVHTHDAEALPDNADPLSLHWDSSAFPTFGDVPVFDTNLPDEPHEVIPEPAKTFDTTEETPIELPDSGFNFSALTDPANAESPVAEEPSTESLDNSLSWDFSGADDAPVLAHEPLAGPGESAQFPVQDTTEQEPVWFGNDLSEDQPIKEFEFDEFGNLIASPATTADLPDEPAPVQEEFVAPEVPIAPLAEEHVEIPEEQPVEVSAESPLLQQEDAELEEERFIFNETKEPLTPGFGNEGFQFTAPLESVAMTAPKDQFSDELTAEQLKLIIEAAQLVNSNIKLDEVLNSIVQAASLLTQADRGTLYIVDHPSHEIWSKVIRGDDIEEIRLGIGQGLAGWVAQTGETINIEDASHDTRFDANIDRQTGYKTRSMLCFPIKNKAGIIIAVIQLLNSKRGTFTSLDETFLTALSVHIAIALENAELVKQLLKTDRLTSLGKVAKFLISDIKKPILTIKHLAEHIRKKNVSDDVNQVISMMIEQSNIVVDLVLTTLSFSEGKAVLNKKVIGSHRVLTELLDLLAEYVDYRKTKLFKKLGPDVLLNIDRREMYQAFFQITKNACDAMPQGGELYVTARTSEDDSKLIIAFRDKGVGIPPSILEKILVPFMSHGKPHGVGLGLPITEKIVKEHDGSLIIESELGEGATVTIELPIMKEF